MSSSSAPRPPIVTSPAPAAGEPVFHDAFYKFARLADPDAVVVALRELTHALLGSILVAHEGINGMLAGGAPELDAFQLALASDARFESQLGGVEFKRSPCVTAPFGRMKVRRRREILPLGVPDVDAVGHTRLALSPAEWRVLLASDDVILIDNRNSFEYRLGRFTGAIDPQVHNFRDFPRYVQAHAADWKASGKRVAMYCTGGIRCEKTSAFMAQLDLPVYELSGGILNYFLQLPDAEKEWEGECFVFDNRVALDTHLQETGTTIDTAYAGDPDEAWRLQRARRLAVQELAVQELAEPDETLER